jgi:uncharacterized membrane protein YeiH
MVLGKKADEETIVDGSAFILNNPVAPLLLMGTSSIRLMCMLCYCIFAGCNHFKSVPASSAPSYKFVSYIFACVGGGVIVPIFLNGIPVVLANDAIFISISIAYLIHTSFPIVREIVTQSNIVKIALIVMFETFRAGVTVGLIGLANTTIKNSVFELPFFGPIICGGVAGCGGAFLPFNKVRGRLFCW